MLVTAARPSFGQLRNTSFYNRSISTRPSRVIKRSRQTVTPKAYSITFKRPDGSESEVDCEDDTYILDAGMQDGLDLPYSCQSGSCSSCTAKVVSGELDQEDQSFLTEEQIADGYALICVSYPKSDLVLETNKEEELV